MPRTKILADELDELKITLARVVVLASMARDPDKMEMAQQMQEFLKLGKPTNADQLVGMYANHISTTLRLASRLATGAISDRTFVDSRTAMRAQFEKAARNVK